MPSRSATPGRKPSMSASACSTSAITVSTPSGDFRSTPIERRPRFRISRFGFEKSPPTAPARSTRTTSAPMSASIIAANGPGPIPAISTTLMPDSGPDTSFPHWLDPGFRADVRPHPREGRQSERELKTRARPRDRRELAGGRERAERGLQILATEADVRDHEVRERDVLRFATVRRHHREAAVHERAHDDVAAGVDRERVQQLHAGQTVEQQAAVADRARLAGLPRTLDRPPVDAA